MLSDGRKPVAFPLFLDKALPSFALLSVFLRGRGEQLISYSKALEIAVFDDSQWSILVLDVFSCALV